MSFATYPAKLVTGICFVGVTIWGAFNKFRREPLAPPETVVVPKDNVDWRQRCFFVFGIVFVGLWLHIAMEVLSSLLRDDPVTYGGAIKDKVAAELESGELRSKIEEKDKKIQELQHRVDELQISIPKVPDLPDETIAKLEGASAELRAKIEERDKKIIDLEKLLAEAELHRKEEQVAHVEVTSGQETFEPEPRKHEGVCKEDGLECAKCRVTNPRDAFVCVSCGSTIAKACRSCGNPNPLDATVCVHCGIHLHPTGGN